MGIDGNNVVYSFTTVVIGYGGGTVWAKEKNAPAPGG